MSEKVIGGKKAFLVDRIERVAANLHTLISLHTDIMPVVKNSANITKMVVHRKLGIMKKRNLKDFSKKYYLYVPHRCTMESIR